MQLGGNKSSLKVDCGYLYEDNAEMMLVLIKLRKQLRLMAIIAQMGVKVINGHNYEYYKYYTIFSFRQKN